MRKFELPAGNGGVGVDPDHPTDRHRRFRRAIMGKGTKRGEVASLAHHLQYFIPGEEVAEVAAEIPAIVPGRGDCDNVCLALHYASDARGRIWGGQVSVGNSHGLQGRVLASEGSPNWHQETPEDLRFDPIGGMERTIAGGYDGLSSLTDDATRFRPGHPEGHAPAFANLNLGFACARVTAGLSGDSDPYLQGLPETDDQHVTLAYIEAVMKSFQDQGHCAPAVHLNNSAGP